MVGFDQFEKQDIDLLWQSFLNGDDESFSLIYKHHINGLLSYGRKLTTNSEIVHDSLQEIFMDLFLKRKKLGVKIHNLKSYLFISLRHSIVKKVTKDKKHQSIEIGDHQETIDFKIEYSSQDKLIQLEIDQEIKDQLKIAIDSLPPRQKEVIYLKFEEELNYIDISKIMDVTVESARKSLHRAILTLRKIVEPSAFYTH